MHNKISSTPTGWHMRRALRLAEQGKGWTAPNPMVGAVIVKDGERIGEGFHAQYGGPHAEVVALQSIEPGRSMENTTLYVTLEPCCHQGKTPPCIDAILKSGIRHIVIATEDPSEKVKGKGIAALRAAGLHVEVGLLETEAQEQNRFFFTYHQKKRPFITVKAAISIDGKISAKPGERSSLTGIPAQRYLHALRHEHEAILVGAGTVIVDDPHLGVRHIKGRDPLRVILMGNRPLSSTAQVFRDENVLLLQNASINHALELLYERGITSVLVEGGKNIFEAFLGSGCVDHLELFLSPIFLGKEALPFADLDQVLALKQVHFKKLGKDMLLTAQLQ